MPFTLAHPAAALPLWSLIRRGYLPLAPFAIGAMAPDFEYLLRLEPYALVSHSLRGVLLYCLPGGVLTFLVWGGLVRPVGRALVALPVSGARLPRDVAGWAVVVLALLLGSASHVGWDALTHRDAWGPEVIPALKLVAFSVRGYDVPWYNVLQLLSSLAGMVVVGVWLWREGRGRDAGTRALLTPWRLRAWATLGAVAIAMATWNAPRQGIMTHVTPTKLVIGRMVVGGLLGLVIGLVALAILHRAGRFALSDETITS